MVRKQPCMTDNNPRNDIYLTSDAKLLTSHDRDVASGGTKSTSRSMKSATNDSEAAEITCDSADRGRESVVDIVRDSFKKPGELSPLTRIRPEHDRNPQTRKSRQVRWRLAYTWTRTDRRVPPKGDASDEAARRCPRQSGPDGIQVAPVGKSPVLRQLQRAETLAWVGVDRCNGSFSKALVRNTHLGCRGGWRG